MTGDDRTRTSPEIRVPADVVTRLRYMAIALLAERRPVTVPGAAPGWFLGAGTQVVGRSPGDGGVRLDDPEASRRHFSLALKDGECWIRDLGSHNGTWVNGVRLEDEGRLLSSGDVVRVGGSLLVYESVILKEGLQELTPRFGASLSRIQAERHAELVAATQTPVLVLGPTGAGKERLVRRIHEASGRSGRFVPVNCATFNRELLGSELFGHVPGAFSGAERRREGLVKAADGGTLFLDEIADLPLDQQAGLLRVLQEGRVRPVGADEEEPVDLRVVAATHSDLKGMMARQEFRSDLYARLAGFTIELPGLAERRSEILDLFAELLDDQEVLFGRDVAEALLRYDWPMNVRELQRLAENTTLFRGGDGSIDLALLPEEIRVSLAPDEPDASSEAPSETPRPPPEEIPGAPTREELEQLLREHDGSVAGVARSVGKHRMQVYRWMKAYAMNHEHYRKS